MVDILLATKIHIPPLRHNLVSRKMLIDRLNEGLVQNCRLTLISAPAGYGKSTLLSEWVAQIGNPAAWLTLETGENSPARFWNYVATALATLPFLRQSGTCEAILKALQASRPPTMDNLLSKLVNDCSRLKERAVLVLDDLHTITESKIHQDLVFLIDHLPLTTTGLHLVVASRMDPPWPLARWRVRSELNELRPADLRFLYEETDELLNQVLQFNLESRHVAALQNRTEGWVAGLQMAALSMQGVLKTQGSAGVSHFIENFTGSHRFILDYLVEEVISQQPAEMRDFLQDTSILDRFSAPLCDALLDRHDSHAVLDHLEKANLFLVALDDERLWYRYHHLFAELLLKRLKQTQPEHIAELHQRASDWYAENHFLSEAIRHALDAGDIQRVNEYVSGNALAMVDNAELLDVLRHFEEISDQQLFSKPWLCVAYAWVKAYVDPSGEIDRILLRALQSVSDTEDALERQHLTSHLDAVWAYVAWVKGRADLALGFARTALENVTEDDWKTRCHVLNIQGLSLQYLDDLAGAGQSFEAAILLGQKMGRSVETIFAYTNLAFTHLLQGQLHQAYSLCQYALNNFGETVQTVIQMPVLSYAYATMSLVQLEWNAVECAVSSARQGVELAEHWNQADTLHYALTCLTQTLGAAGDLEEAFTTNRRAMQLAMNVSPWFQRISACDDVELNLRRGDITAAAHKLEEIEPLIDEKVKQGSFMVTKAYLLNSQEHFSELIRELEKPILVNEQSGEYRNLLNLLTFQALALHALGREEDALRVIDHCLDIAEPEGYVRIFVERGAPMLRLLQIALTKGIHTEYIHRLLPAFEHSTTIRPPATPTSSRLTPASQAASLTEPLSERELQVLRLLDSPLTSDEIAAELFVSVNTIRTHIRNIYSKLGVHSRIEAIQKARDFSIH